MAYGRVSTRWVGWLLAALSGVVACASETSNPPDPGSGNAGSGPQAGQGAGGSGNPGAGSGGQTSTAGNGSGSAGAGTAGKGSAGNSPSCSGITGTYDMTRARSKTNPGSCPPTLQVNPKIPGKVTADNNEPSGYRVEIGYSNLDTPNDFNFKPCTNNVAGCAIFATCSPTGATDQIKLTISGNTISGTIERYDNDDNCSVNFLLSGTRK